ncbi:putative Solute carrier family 22 member 3 [Hypsibius exemplaris]|uniref:Solute carrier family 22 member 3 n=1 Tax=Hypsibius exemplaris TaxID=2072580 RepID=A0A1W0XCN4_HYPEX|nr:putative Solute carrier family 22 member 3 [Hypsibius exemplaris]
MPPHRQGVSESEDATKDGTIFRKAEAAYNSLLHIVGSPGRYQIILIFLLGLGTLSVTVNDYVSIFYATPPTGIYCKIPEHHTTKGVMPDCIAQFIIELQNSSKTDVDFLYAEIDPEYCYITPPGANLTNSDLEFRSCRGWNCPYDVIQNFTHEREWTVVAQWGLSCEKYWLFTLSLVLYFTGAFVGTLLFEMVTRRLGFKSYMWVWFLISVVLCLGFGFEKAFWLFVLMRFLLGVIGHGLRYSCTRLMFDLLPSEQRLGVVTALAFSSGTGLVVLGMLAYFIMDWRFILYGTLIFSAIGVSYQWTVPESLQWLLSTSQTLQAQQVFYKILAKNRQFVTAGVDATISSTSATLSQAHQSDQTWRIMLRSPDTSRPFTALLSLCFICNMVSYGSLLLLPHLGGSIYLNVTVSGLLEICGVVCGLLLLRRMSLCRIIFVSVFMGGLLCFTAGLIPGGLPKMGTVEITRTALILLGRVCIATAAAYLLEMFLRVMPLSCRNSAFGLYGAVATFGAAVGSMFNQLARFEYQVPFLVFGILCVTCAFLTFALPVDDFLEKPLVLDPEDFTIDRDVNNSADYPEQDEEDLVFEPLPEMTRSPYILS